MTLNADLVRFRCTEIDGWRIDYRQVYEIVRGRLTDLRDFAGLIARLV